MNMSDEEIITYWRGAYDRMAARSIEDGARIAALSAENERLRKALEPFANMAGMMPLTHGPNNEPVENDEPVNVSCCGFHLGDLTAADLNAVYALEQHT